MKPNKKVWNRARLLDVVEEYNRLTDRPAELVAFEEKCRMDREAVETVCSFYIRYRLVADRGTACHSCSKLAAGRSDEDARSET